jgi:hypothetical protein
MAEPERKSFLIPARRKSPPMKCLSLLLNVIEIIANQSLFPLSLDLSGPGIAAPAIRGQ